METDRLKNVERELHQMNIYLKDIAQSLKKTSNDKREENEEDDGK